MKLNSTSMGRVGETTVKEEYIMVLISQCWLLQVFFPALQAKMNKMDLSMYYSYCYEVHV